MEDHDIQFFLKWGFWIWGGGIIFVIASFWVQDVNRKLRYLMNRAGGRTQAGDDKFMAAAPHPPAQNTNVLRRTVSPVAGICIIGGAIFLMLIIPIWLRNR